MFKALSSRCFSRANWRVRAQSRRVMEVAR